MKITKYILEISIEDGYSNRNIKIDDILNDNIPEYIESSTQFNIYDTITLNDVIYEVGDLSSPNYKTVNGSIEVVTKITLRTIHEDVCVDVCDDDLCPF